MDGEGHIQQMLPEVLVRVSGDVHGRTEASFSLLKSRQNPPKPRPNAHIFLLQRGKQPYVVQGEMQQV